MATNRDVLPELAIGPYGRTRADCVRSAVASVRIEGGDVDTETQNLLGRWADGALSDEALMTAILKPHVGQR